MVMQTQIAGVYWQIVCFISICIEIHHSKRPSSTWENVKIPPIPLTFRKYNLYARISSSRGEKEKPVIPISHSPITPLFASISHVYEGLFIITRNNHFLRFSIPREKSGRNLALRFPWFPFLLQFSTRLCSTKPLRILFPRRCRSIATSLARTTVLWPESPSSLCPSDFISVFHEMHSPSFVGRGNGAFVQRATMYTTGLIGLFGGYSIALVNARKRILGE